MRNTHSIHATGLFVLLEGLKIMSHSGICNKSNNLNDICCGGQNGESRAQHPTGLVKQVEFNLAELVLGFLEAMIITFCCDDPACLTQYSVSVPEFVTSVEVKITWPVLSAPCRQSKGPNYGVDSYTFSFSRVFSECTSQACYFEETAGPMVS